MPNPSKEMGLKSELRYNRDAFVRKTAIFAGVSAVIIGLFVWMRSR